MNRFFQIALISAALSSLASAAVITMSSSAVFTGGLDLVIDSGLFDNSTTRLSATYNGPGTTVDLTSVGQQDRLALGTLIIDENATDDLTPPDITAAEHDAGYQLGITVNTLEWGILNFLAAPANFNLSGFSPGASDSDTTDGPEEIQVNFASIDRTVGLYTLRFSIVDDAFGADDTLEFNQGSAAETIYLRAEVLRIDEPNSQVPEPSSMALMGAGLLGVGILARRKGTPKAA